MNTDRLIPMDDIELQFNQHLKLSNNERIIFSGRFGTGKTTFLNHFFDNQMQAKQRNPSPNHYAAGNAQHAHHRFFTGTTDSGLRDKKEIGTGTHKRHNVHHGDGEK